MPVATRIAFALLNPSDEGVQLLNPRVKHVDAHVSRIPPLSRNPSLTDGDMDKKRQKRGVNDGAPYSLDFHRLNRVAGPLY